MKPKNRNLYIVVGFVVIILIILAVSLTSMKKNNDILNSKDVIPNQNDDVEEVTDSTSDKQDFIDSLISQDEIILTEQEKLELVDFSKRVFSPVYYPAISLKTDTGLDHSKESNAPWTCVITPDGNQTKTFDLQFNQKISANKFIWQVSFYPFSGGMTSVSQQVDNILLSGELSNKATSVTIDFAKVYAAERAFFQPKISRYNIDVSKNFAFKISDPDVIDAVKESDSIALRTYYVRVFPVDNRGNSIADAGSGLPILYGDIKQQVITGNRFKLITTKFPLLLAKNPGTVTHNGEFPNDFIEKDLATMYNTDTKSYSVLPTGFPENTKELLIQVSLINFTQNDLNDPAGLVFEKRLTSDNTNFEDLKNTHSTFGITLDFTSFIPSDNNLPVDKYVRYYVRAIAISDGLQPGSVNTSYSKTVMIDYGKNQSQRFKYYPEIKIDPEIPSIEKLSFTPVRWEAYDWQYHYIVTRQPTEKEVFIGWGSDTLYEPLPMGTKIDFTPQPENKSWWEEAWDAISDFFSDLVDFTAKLVNWVGTAYADLKAGVINIAVSALPESWQESDA